MSEDQDSGGLSTLVPFAGIAGALGTLTIAMAAESSEVKAWAIIGFSAIACSWLWLRRCRRQNGDKA